MKKEYCISSLEEEELELVLEDFKAQIKEISLKSGLQLKFIKMRLEDIIFSYENKMLPTT